MKARCLTALILGLAAVGCDSTGVGNPGHDLTVTVTNDLQAEPQATDPSEQLSSSEVNHAVLVFAELRWLPCDAAANIVRVPGPFVVDLATGRVDPPIPPIPTVSGGFCGIDAPLATAPAPAELAGRSLFFSGQRTDGTLFILYAAMGGTVRMRPVANAIWDAETTQHLIWALRPHRWLVPTELDTADTAIFNNVQQVIVIDINRHPLLYAVVRNRIGGRATLHVDLNNNGILDADERAGAAWVGQGLASID
jgi:hypothetical protein